MSISFLHEVYRDREELARVLKKHTGIRRIVEDLYPDSAHFIYELLQNADDAGASHATFELRNDLLTFQHDGRPFSEQDIWGITNIGEGTKPGDDDKIGKFGVGFKAVFAYSETPEICSPTFSFRIQELVLPSEIDAPKNLGNLTRFSFPFNNPKKTKELAYREVLSGLNDLAETTLLFLNNLESIEWKAENATTEILRVRHSHYHVEVLKQLAGSTTFSTHFLKFEEPAVNLPKQRVAIAFALDLIQGVERFDSQLSLQQLEIVPAKPGRVAVYFPAEKESSHLRFHLHAPFVPELSRASIKETPANGPLFTQLAQLTARSLYEIKRLGLLSIQFLAVLPNLNDGLSHRYQPIRKAIVEEMKNKPLTPTHSNAYKPAANLRSSRASIKSLLSAADLRFLSEENNDSVDWVANAPLKNGDADRFLDSLSISRWDIHDLLRAIIANAGRNIEPTRLKRFHAWMATKSHEWHQSFYALLLTEVKDQDELARLQNASIVLLQNGTYSTGNESFFPSDGVESGDILPRIDARVYTHGKNSSQRTNSRKLLEEIGVRSAGEFELVESILKKRYRSAITVTDKSTYESDLKRFIALLNNDSSKARTFQGFKLFERTDGVWVEPDGVFLDSPFLDTGLCLYFQTNRTLKADKLSQWYETCSIPSEQIGKFAALVGAIKQIPISTVKCKDNPEWPYLRQAPGDKINQYGIDRDYAIVGLKQLLANPNLEVAKLVWSTMRTLHHNPNYLEATYKKNKSSEPHRAASQLVYTLREAQWVPQSNGSFVRPTEASRENLPEGFSFDSGWKWVKTLRFGEEAVKRTEDFQRKRAVARELGFGDDESLERAKAFAALPRDEQLRILNAASHPTGELSSSNEQDKDDQEESNACLDYYKLLSEDFVRSNGGVADTTEDFETDSANHPIMNLDRRTENLASSLEEKITNSPLETQRRKRTVRHLLETLDPQVRQSLHNWYRGRCQICDQTFYDRIGSPFFVAGHIIERRHAAWLNDPANTICLCPNHFAKWRHAVREVSIPLPEQIQNFKLQTEGNSEQPSLSVLLCGEECSIRYSDRHALALRVLLARFTHADE